MVVIVYDTTQEKSFIEADMWLNSVRKLVQKNVEVFLVGSKCDLKKERRIAKRLGAQFARERHIHFEEVSVLNLASTNTLLEKITSYALKTRKETAYPEQIPKKEEACIGCIIF